MSRPWPILLGLAMVLYVVAAASPAAAAKKCPPLPVDNGDVCECKAHNYATATDSGVTIILYDSSGTPVKTCGPLNILSKAGTFCSLTFPSFDNCGCETKGDGGSTRVSLSVYVPPSFTAQAAVECR